MHNSIVGATKHAVSNEYCREEPSVGLKRCGFAGKKSVNRPCLGKYPLDGSIVDMLDISVVEPTRIRDVESWILTLADMKESKRYTPPDFLRPFHLLTFALVLKAGKYGGLSLPEKFINYAVRMGLYEAADIPPPKSIQKSSPSGRFRPVTALTDWIAIADTAIGLSDICMHQAASKQTRQSLATAIVELLENCYAHAKTGKRDFHGLVAAQAWFQGNLAQIAIADVGVGIRARLADNANLHDLLRTQNACELATRYGVTADESCHAGYGLTLAKDLLQSNGGSLMVISKNEAVTCNSSGIYSSRMKAVWNGTLIIFEWDTSRALDASAVYRRWPTPRGFDDDELI